MEANQSSVEELTTQSEVPAELDAVSSVCIGCKPKIKLINNHLKLATTPFTFTFTKRMSKLVLKQL